MTEIKEFMESEHPLIIISLDDKDDVFILSYNSTDGCYKVKSRKSIHHKFKNLMIYDKEYILFLIESFCRGNRRNIEIHLYVIDAFYEKAYERFENALWMCMFRVKENADKVPDDYLRIMTKVFDFQKNCKCLKC